MAITITNWTNKWCPQAIVEPHGANRNAAGQPLPGTLCMGEDCIAWIMEGPSRGMGYCRAWGTIAPFIQRKPDKEDET